MAAAVSLCRRIRTPSVRRPRSARNASIGPGTAPTAFTRNPTASIKPGSLVMTAPPIRSECPPMYFVTLCTTTSAPRANGCWSAGDANVLSTTTCAPDACASAATASMSTTLSNGFDGVSTHTNRVCGRIASARASASARSHVVSSSPHGPSTRVSRRYVPPYTSSASTT